MMRRIWVTALAVAMVTTLLPASLFAEETRPQASLASIAKRVNTSRIVTVNVIRVVPVQLQQAQQQTTGESFFKTKNGKITLAVAILAGSIAGGYALTRGPEPRQWP